MGAFSIAFDIIIVGALSLPWVLLVIHLFFDSEIRIVFAHGESRIKKLLTSVNKQPAVTGVLLFAMTYSLGSAVSRIAQDFFNDDDLGVWVTETGIRNAVYCQEQKLIPQTLINSLTDKPEQFKTMDSACPYAHKGHEDPAGDIFHIQEGALLSMGSDANERLRQFHDQIMVLRGATFDGLLAFSLCLFWWYTRFQRFQPWLRFAVPTSYLSWGLIALRNHVHARAPSDPPYMEFTLLVLGLAGWYILWPHTPKGKGVQGESGTQNERGRLRVGYLVLSLFLTATAFLGWWTTQVLYDQQVIYSYKALDLHLIPTK
jgi:hypothetical protein